MNKELLRLKKQLLKANAPTRSEELSRALRIIFEDIEATPQEEQDAFNILGWDYESRAELFGRVDQDSVKVCDMGELDPMIINYDTEHQIESETIKVINIVKAGDVEIVDNMKYPPVVFAKGDFPDIDGAIVFTNEDMI